MPAPILVAAPVVGFVAMLCCRKRPAESRKTCCPPNKPVRGVPCPQHPPPKVHMHRPAVAGHRAPIVACEIFPWLPERVDRSLGSAWKLGMRTPRDLATHALADVYKTTPEGEPISWPAEPGDCVAILAIEQRVLVRAALVAADMRDAQAEQAWIESGGR